MRNSQTIKAVIMPLDNLSTPSQTSSEFTKRSIERDTVRSLSGPGPSARRNSITQIEIFSARLSNPLVTSIAGSIGGLASGVVTCPLDVIKTKLQAQGGFTPIKLEHAGAPPTYRGLVGTATSIWLEDGIRGMYRGLFPIMLGYFPTWAVYFTVYDSSKEFWYAKFGEDIGETRRNKMASQFLASLTAGACSTLLTNPIWVIKTRLMSQVTSPTHRGGRPPWQYKSTMDAFRKMYQHEGLKSFYSGLSPALLGLTHVAVQFPLYEYLKFRFTGLEMGEKGSQGPSWLSMSAATVISKVCASSATYPHEVIRTRLQTQQRSIPVAAPEEMAFRAGMSRPGELRASTASTATVPRYRGIFKTFHTILREEGWRAFYNGMGTNMLRAVPAATTTILTYEFMVGRIHRLQAEGKRKLDLEGVYM